MNLRRLSACAAILALACQTCPAIINPHFTPKHLVEDSSVIVVGVLRPAGKPGGWKLTGARLLKGTEPRAHTVSLTGCKKDEIEDIQATLKENGRRPVILFAGTMRGEKRAYMHIRGAWLAAKLDGPGSWLVTGNARDMGGTLAGGTDMLIRMTEYLLKDPQPDVPVSAGVTWAGDRIKVGTVPGRSAGMAPVEIGKKRRIHLFVSSVAGDKLFRATTDPDELETTFKDVTAASRLDTKSSRFTWMDVNRDGLADLISWDGTALSVRLAGAGGTFAPGGAGWSAKLPAGCIGLTACSTDGRPAVLVSGEGAPVLLVANGGKGWQPVALPAGPDVPQMAACIAADLDSDGFVDILQPGAAGSVLWRGRPGGFHKAVAVAVAAGNGAARAAVADFDGDGTLDIFLSGTERNSLWENDGRGRFKNVFEHSGSMSYKCAKGAAEARAMDLNHDGRPDLCLIYPRGNIVYHFNRGFRCFGEEGEVRLPGLEPGDAGALDRRPGLVAMAVGDYDEANSQDLIVLLTTGEVYCYPNNQMDMPGVRLRLPKGVTGPVVASCWQGRKFPVCTGVAVVTGHSPSAYVSARMAGPLTIKWRAPGGRQQVKKVVVEEGPVDVVINAAKEARVR